MQILKKTLTATYKVPTSTFELSFICIPSLDLLLLFLNITVFDKKSVFATLLINATHQAVAYQIINTVFHLS